MPYKKIKKFLLLTLRFVISFGILFYLFRKSDWGELRKIFTKINFFYYFLALSCVIVFQSLVALRWKWICNQWKVKKNFFFFFRIYLTGFSLNTIFPGIIASDALRSYFLVKNGLEWKKATFSVVLDRIYGLLGILVILALFLPFKASFLPNKFKIFLFITSYTTLSGFLMLSFLIKKLSKNDIFLPLYFPFSLKPLLLGFLIQTFFVLQFLSLGYSLNLSLGTLYFVIIPIISFLAALPLSISGLGVREGTLSYFLHLLGYPVEYGLSLGLLSYSLILISSLPGLLFYLKGKYQ
ncbi:MAG: lysylphosphatidylglycerol synthase transmembrane domain-containing protein [Caldimicrobium sp.]